MSVEKIPLQPSYRKEDGMWVLHTHSNGRTNPEIPLPFSNVLDSLCPLKAGQIGGNHKHPRQEAFIGIGEGLTIYWLDEDGKRHEEDMYPNGEPMLFVVPPFVPHATVNHGNGSALIYEFASEEQHDVVRIEVYQENNER